MRVKTREVRHRRQFHPSRRCRVKTLKSNRPPDHAISDVPNWLPKSCSAGYKEESRAPFSVGATHRAEPFSRCFSISLVPVLCGLVVARATALSRQSLRTVECFALEQGAKRLECASMLGFSKATAILPHSVGYCVGHCHCAAQVRWDAVCAARQITRLAQYPSIDRAGRRRSKVQVQDHIASPPLGES